MSLSASARWLLWASLSFTVGCEEEKPPAPPQTPAQAEASGGASSAAAEAFLAPDVEDAAILTYAADRGSFADTSTLDVVPEQARGLVRVKLLAGEPAPPGMVWVTNLRTPEADGRFRLRPVPRDMFEELALGQGLSSDVTLPEGLEPPQTVAAPEGVIVYKTAWCGVCKKVEAYLTRKGVDYEAKDIEKDRQAAAELSAKAKTQGVKTGSVPVIDVGGQLIVGFDRARLEKLL